MYVCMHVCMYVFFLFFNEGPGHCIIVCVPRAPIVAMLAGFWSSINHLSLAGNSSNLPEIRHCGIYTYVYMLQHEHHAHQLS